MNSQNQTDRYSELAPLFALDALDGAERTEFSRHLPFCPQCLADVEVNQMLCARLGTAVAPVVPAPALRSKLMTMTALPVKQPSAVWLPLAMAASVAAVATSAGWWTASSDRDRVRTELLAAQLGAERSEQAATQARERLASLQSLATEARSVQMLAAAAGSRSAHLQGHPEASPSASACILWNPARGEAVLLVSGLPPAPEGKAYQVWVITKGTPVPAGLFQSDPEGRAAFRLPQVDTSKVGAFAVTLEAAQGVPAPTGPMVLADRS